MLLRKHTKDGRKAFKAVTVTVTVQVSERGGVCVSGRDRDSYSYRHCVRKEEKYSGRD